MFQYDISTRPSIPAPKLGPGPTEIEISKY